MNQTVLTNNLPTFRILFLVKGILSFMGCFFCLLYILMGSFFFQIVRSSDMPNDMPFNPGLVFIVIGLIGFVILVVMGILNLLVSKYIKEKKNYNFIFVMGVLSCMSGILGILLGIFTIIELNKPHIKAMFYPELNADNNQFVD